MKLLSLEIKRILKSPIFYISIAIIVGFMLSQFKIDNIHDEDPIMARKKHEEMTNEAKKNGHKEIVDGEEVLIDKNGYIINDEASYGTKKTKDINVIQKGAIDALIMDYSRNNYVTYPFGFLKEVELAESEQDNMAEYISKLTGISKEELKNLAKENIFPENIDYHATNRKEFINIMNSVDTLIGGGTSFTENKIEDAYGDVPKTFEDAVTDFELIKTKDKITGAYAREFCDYLGIIITFVPILLAVYLWYQDKTSKALDIINSKSVSSKKIVLTRILAMFLLFTLSIIILSTIYNIIIISTYGVGNVDIFAFYKYIVLWILPNLLFVLTFGTLITILTGYPVAIIGMLIMWIIFVSGNVNNLNGGYGWPLIMRANGLRNTTLYFESLGLIYFNRIIYTVISIIFIILSIKIFDLKRNGGMVKVERSGNNRKKRA